MVSEFALKINGEIYAGWKRYAVQRSVEQIAGAFTLEVTDRWALDQERRHISPNDKCELIYGGQVLVAGYIDTVTRRCDSGGRTMTVSGRDRTADLVDCSAQHATGQIYDRDLVQIARLIAAPYGIAVTADANVAPSFAEVTIDDGESGFEVIERLARHRGVLLLSQQGDLYITQPSSERIDVPLMRGHNLLDSEVTISARERFHTYLVKAQSAADDHWPGQQAAEPLAKVIDSRARAPRLKILIAEEGNNSDDCKQRGEWQRNIAIARGTRVHCTVQGHEYAPGQLWRDNRLVRVVDPYIGIDQDLYIAAVEYTGGDDGTLTKLSLAPPAAYKRLAVPEAQEAF